MILADYFESKPNVYWQLAKQIGINHAVVRLPELDSFDETNIEHWKIVYKNFTEYGLKPTVIEPVPNRLHDHIKAGDHKRDESIEKFIKILPIMNQLNIRIICVNFMAKIGWYRTSNDIVERGNAKVTGFDISKVSIDPSISISHDKLWGNLEYFLRAIVPEIEKYDIKIALHPDDPPIPMLSNIGRILISKESVNRAINIVPSDNIGVALCQGCYGAMGEDISSVIQYFGEMQKIFFVHFRDVRGTKELFHETFHDNGPTDMPKIIKLYKNLKYEGPIRVDHVPTMAGEDNNKPGYETLGRLFAIGYLKGLLDSIGYDYC